jgi:subtilisin family serine protease
MGGVDKLHQLGIKGKGIKIGIVDTGVDYRHPALGAGFGPGFKIAGGWAFVADNGTTISDPDPLTTCYGGGHGTHVAGLIGMEPVSGQFNIMGVAPEATIYAYKALDCNGQGGTDNIAAAMLKAQEDGVNIVSMSIGTGPQSFVNATDPLADISNKLAAAGIAVIVAAANDGSRGKNAGNLYTDEQPSSIPGNIAIGATAIKEFPLVYSAVDSLGSTIKYASIFPLDFPNGADVFLVDDACNSDSWNSAMSTSMQNPLPLFY